MASIISASGNNFDPAINKPIDEDFLKIYNKYSTVDNLTTGNITATPYSATCNTIFTGTFSTNRIITVQAGVAGDWVIIDTTRATFGGFYLEIKDLSANLLKRLTINTVVKLTYNGTIWGVTSTNSNEIVPLFTNSLGKLSSALVSAPGSTNEIIINSSGALSTDSKFTINSGTLNVTGTGKQKFTFSGDSGSSMTTGGVINLDNSSNLGSAVAVYSNAGATATGDLITVKSNNTAFTKNGLTIDYQGTGDSIQVFENGAEKLSLKGAELKINNAYTFPTADGASGKFLSTDGAGNLSWQTSGSFAWGSSVTGTSSDGLALTLGNNTVMGTSALYLARTNTQNSTNNLITLKAGTKAIDGNKMIDFGSDPLLGGTDNVSAYGIYQDTINNSAVGIGYGIYQDRVSAYTGYAYGLYQRKITGGAGYGVGIQQDVVSDFTGDGYGIYQGIIADYDGDSGERVGYYVENLNNIYANSGKGKFASWNNSQNAYLGMGRSESPFEILHSRTSQSTSGTLADDFSLTHFKRQSVQTGVGGTFTSTGSVMKLENVATQAFGTLTDSTALLKLIATGGNGYSIDNTEGGGIALPVAIATQASAYTATRKNVVILGSNAQTATITINLPQASTCAGQIMFIKKTNANAVGIVLDPFGTELIEGVGTYTIATYGAPAIIMSDGSSWWKLN